MIKRVSRALQLLQTLGPAWVWFRVRYAVRRRSGALVRRSPLGEWPVPAAREIVLRGLARDRAIRVGEGAVREADAVLRGQFRLFSRHEVAAGLAPAWEKNPRTGQAAPRDRHWSQLGDFAFGDIKGIWELSRFPWAFALGRAFVRTGDEAYAEAFWRLFEHWLDHNPPNQGPNWMCGQEATFRLIAVCWAAEALARSAASDAARRERLAGFVLATGRRIAANLDYALSQSNNHGVSECVGLLTAALYLPTEKEAAAWRAQGWRALQRQIADLVYSDGGFAQHSAVYHRVLVHDLLWLVCLLRHAGEPVPAWLSDGLRRAVEFLDALLTPETGRVPVYGANDGANILPLADTDYLDFRPVVQAGYAVLDGTGRFPPGPWDEAADWLAPGWRRTDGRRTADGGRKSEDGGRRTDGGGRTADDGERIGREEAQKAQKSDGGRTERAHFPEAGIVVWRTADLRVFLRCPTRFRHRPSQADLLHVDLEWRGQAIAHDAGTFSYNTPGAFAGGLKEARYHNTLTLDDAEPLQKVARFLYLPWPRGQAAWDKATGEFVATHDGWARLGLSHVRRLAQPSPEVVAIRDRVHGAGRHRGRLHWLLADLPYHFEPHANRLVLHTRVGDYALTWSVPAGKATLVRADPETARGWWSPYYDYAAPALSLAIEFDFSDAVELSTTFAPV